MKEQEKMQQNAAHSYDGFNKAYGYRRINPWWIYGGALGFSVIWVALLAYYIGKSAYSLANISMMMPHEFGGLLAGVIMPLVFAWSVALFIERNMNSNYERRVLYPFIQSIIDPHGDQGAIVAVIREKLAEESEGLAKLITQMKEISADIKQVALDGEGFMKTALDGSKRHLAGLTEISGGLDRISGDIDENSKRNLEKIKSAAAELGESAIVAREKSAAACSDMSLKMEQMREAIDKTLGMTDDMISDVEEAKGTLDSTAANVIASTDVSVKSITDASNLLVASADAMAERSAQIIGNIEERSSQFVLKSNMASAKISDVVASMDGAVGNLSIISEDTRRVASAAMDKISEYSAFIANRLESQANVFKDKTGEIMKTAHQAASQFAAMPELVGLAANGTVKSLQDLEGEIGAKRDVILGISRDVSDAIGVVIAKAGDSAVALAEATLTMKDAMDNVASSIDVSAAKFDGNSKQIIGSVGAVEQALGGAGGVMAEQAEAAFKFATEIKGALKQQMVDLENTANAVLTNVRLFETYTATQNKNIGDTVEQATVALSAMDAKLGSVANNVVAISTKLDDKLGGVADSILIKANMASSNMNSAMEGLTNVSSTMREASAEMAGITRQLGTDAEHIKREVSGIARASKEAEESVAALAGDLKGAQDIGATLDEVADKFSKFVSSRTSEFDMIANQSSKTLASVASYINKMAIDAQNSVDMFSEKYKEMNKNSELAAVKIAQVMDDITLHKDILRTILAAQNTDPSAFLKRSGKIIGKLNSLAIDLARMLSPEEARDLWGKFNAGAKGVFSRHVADKLGKVGMAAVRQAVANPEFAGFARIFTAEFERLVLALRAIDDAEVVLAALMSSDVGKSYIILKEVL
ncbi:MAG: hypothetical protein FWD15_05960 [Alphaproteobacteria bacterium]|nr:hypothetical protein [Alphaproteobacteria bacterium]